MVMDIDQKKLNDLLENPLHPAAADELRSRRVPHELVGPSHDITEWMVFVRGRSPLVPDFLRETVDLCEQFAATYGGDYEGWAGLLTEAETVE